QVTAADRPIQVGVDEVQPGRRAPVSEQPRLHIVRLQRPPKQRVVEQVDLADRQVVGGSPVGVERTELLIAHERMLLVRVLTVNAGSTSLKLHIVEGGSARSVDE